MNLFNLVATVTLDSSDYEKKVNNAEKDIEQLGSTTERETKKMKINWSGMAKGVDKGLTFMSKSILGAGTALVGLSISTQESRQQMKLLESSFQNSGHSAEIAQETYKNMYGILGDQGQTVEAVSFLAKLGKTQEELNKLTTISAGVYSQFGNALPIEGLTEAILETSKTTLVTGGLSDALEWAGINVEDYNEQLGALKTEQERVDFITKTLDETYSKMGETYQNNQKDVIDSRNAQVELDKAMNELGATTAPMVTEAMRLLAEKLPELTTFLVENKDTIFQVSGVVIGATIAYKGLMIVASIANAIKTLSGIMSLAKIQTTALTVVTNAQTFATTLATVATTALNGALAILTSPITLVIGAIGALIGIVYLLIKNWDTVKEVGAKAVDYILNAWKNVSSWFNENVIQPIANMFRGLWDTIVSIFSFGGRVFVGIKEGITSVFKSVVNGLISGFNKIISVPLKVISNALKTIHNINLPLIGKPFTIVPNGFRIPQIPHLATGDVAQPNNEYLAILGDNKKEQEVVSPLSTMKKAFVEADYENPRQVTYQSNELNASLLIEIRDLLKNMKVYIDGKTLVGAIIGDIDKSLGILNSRKLKGV